jgi:hypothetical protein
LFETGRDLWRPYLSRNCRSPKFRSCCKWELLFIVRLPFGHIFTALIASVSASFRSRAALQLEILALGRQIGVLQRSGKRQTDNCGSALVGVARCSLAGLDIRCVHHEGIDGDRLASQGISFVLDLEEPPWEARTANDSDGSTGADSHMSRENHIWGTPKVHGELLKLGIDVGETNVSKYMVRRRRPPSQTCKTFLDNHVKSMVSVDFFTVPTIRFQVLYVFLVLAHRGVGLFISELRHMQLPSGLPRNSGRHFPGRLRRAICCATATASLARNSLIR